MSDISHQLGSASSMDAAADAPTPSRTVLQRDALEWLEQTGREGFPEKACVVTSLPDWSELKKGQKISLKQYLDWFQKAVQMIFRCCHEGTLVIFLQTDIMTGGQWIDKASLICKEADGAGAILLWHKITFDPEALDVPRRGASADYSHLLCFVVSLESKPGPAGRAAFDSRCAVPDLLPRGRKVYAQGMGTEALSRILRWVAAQDVQVVIDPFCGRGTVLALANELGLSALGVDVDAACVKAAERLDIQRRCIQWRITCNVPPMAEGRNPRRKRSRAMGPAMGSRWSLDPWTVPRHHVCHHVAAAEHGDSQGVRWHELPVTW